MPLPHPAGPVATAQSSKMSLPCVRPPSSLECRGAAILRDTDASPQWRETSGTCDWELKLAGATEGAVMVTLSVGHRRLFR